MRTRFILVLTATLFALLFAGSAQAVTKFYDSSAENGAPHDFIVQSLGLCPPIQTTPAFLNGFTELTDDGLGTVTLEQLEVHSNRLVDFAGAALESTFGPGAFIFIDAARTERVNAPSVSNTTGVGAHGPSGSASGETAEWGVVSGWTVTGADFCISSPVSICNDAGFSHGQTAASILNSSTYDLGTWTFDSAGNYEILEPYLQRTQDTNNLTNVRYVLRGAFHGASLPALPIVGFGALALTLAVVGGRALTGKK